MTHVISRKINKSQLIQAILETMIPAMVKAGYPEDFASALTASASTIGPIIPPSVPMIVVGTLTGLSINKLFAASAFPGILLGIGLMIAVYIISVKRNLPKVDRAPLKEIIKTFIDAFWAIGMTVLILWGILGGVFTPTEAAVVAVAYALIVGVFIYKELKIKDIPRILCESMRSTAAIMVLVGFASLLHGYLHQNKYLN